MLFRSLILVFLFLTSNSFMALYYSTIMWIPIVFDMATEQSLIEILTSIPRLLIGPGPLRSFFGHINFVYFTYIGNVMTFIGSLMWWVQISFMISKIISTRFTFKYMHVFTKYIFLNLISFVLIYSLAYAGSTELRFRGVLYVFFSALFFSYYPVKLNKDLLIKTSILFAIVTFGGLLFG